jgi:uncharacterized protein involved in exopolysaccharide biosynthesis
LGTNSTTEQNADQQLITGMQSRLPATFSTTLSGQTFTLVQIVALLQARIDARNKVTSARGAYKLALAQLAALLASDKDPMVALKRLLLAMFAGQADALADLGVAEPKTTTRSVAEKQASVEKAKATRTARHTMGPKAKLAITGDSTPEVPAAASAATAGTAPAATTAPSGTGTPGHS